jgi:hypothetical protein
MPKYFILDNKRKSFKKTSALIFLNKLLQLRNKQEYLGRTNGICFFHTTRTELKPTPLTILLCRGNVFTEPLSSNVHMQTHRLMAAIYEVRR